MKRIIFMTMIYSALLNGMTDQGQAKDSVLCAKKIAAYMMTAVSKNTSPEQITMCLKEFLRDESLTSEKSACVKKDLVDILSTKIKESISATVPCAHGDEVKQEIRQTIFLDGTFSLISVTSFPPLDKSDEEVLEPRKTSPWYQLSFEDIIKQYCAASAQGDCTKKPLS